jgi:hypothetical protein
MPTNRPRSRAVVLLAFAGLVVALVGRPGVVAAASPSSSASASPGPSDLPPERPPIEVWLDRKLPAAPSPGTTIEVGVTLWDTLGKEIPRMGATLFLRAVPPGGGTPTQAVAISDWRGHYRGRVAVPEGGLDRVELGVSGTICENDVCRQDDWVFPIAGFGPPPDAPVTSVAEARIDAAGLSLAAGVPAQLRVVVAPSADWASFRLPAQVVVRAREPRGPNLATATLSLVDAATGTYEGPITIPRAGDLVLEAATDADGGDATRFGTSMRPVTVAAGVGGGGGAASGSPARDGSADDGVPIVVVVLLALAAILGAGVIVAGFRSGNR